MQQAQQVIALCCASALLGACTPKPEDTAPQEPQPAPQPAAPAQESEAPAAPEAVAANPVRDAYFGNLHVHTAYSFDAVTNGTVATPADAYRWARGEAITAGVHGGRLQIKRPLDWYAVSDHAEYLGMFVKMDDPDDPLSKIPLAKEITSDDQAVAFKAYARVLDKLSMGESEPELINPEMGKSIWQEVVKTADEFNKPGDFTTFPAFEWTGQPDGLNLHRVVLFSSSQNVPDLPLSAIDTQDPVELWKWMDKARAGGATLLAVPHNGNASDGLMFPIEGDDRVKVDAAYSEARMKNEPLYEITQIKGTSETHPKLAPNDEFAGFEIWDYLLSSTDVRTPEHKRGGYARNALVDGLAYQVAGKGNPFKYGFIGDSDTHNAAAAVEEDNYTGKFGMESTAKHRIEGPIPGDEVNNQRAREFSSGGLAAVWAESNTREAIFNAMKRKETFATTGTRLKLRFFGGFELSQDALSDDGWLAKAYGSGVPMGGDLNAAPEGKSPRFIVHALKDPDGANLDRIQIIKGWVDKQGDPKTKIFEVAASGDRKPNQEGKVAPVGNTVDVATATYDNSIGAAELSTVWTDPEFDPALHAVYYMRAIEIPTPRWSTYDAKALGIEPLKTLPTTIQERGWSSPIWYAPGD